MITKKIVEKIIDTLTGTCKSLDEVCDYFNVDSLEFLDNHAEALDDKIFNCDSCGWWYDLGDLSENEDNMICENCYEE